MSKVNDSSLNAAIESEFKKQGKESGTRSKERHEKALAELTTGVRALTNRHPPKSLMDVVLDATAPLLGAPKKRPSEPQEDNRCVASAPQIHRRALWLNDRLQERAWNKHDVHRHGGPDHKTVQKVLDGKKVRADMMDKLVSALNAAPSSKRLPKVTLPEIPEGL